MDIVRSSSNSSHLILIYILSYYGHIINQNLYCFHKILQHAIFFEHLAIKDAYKLDIKKELYDDLHSNSQYFGGLAKNSFLTNNEHNNTENNIKISIIL